MTQTSLARLCGIAVASLAFTIAFSVAAQLDSESANVAAPDDWAASVEQLLSAIETEESRNAPPTEALGRERLALGRLYEQQDEYDLAAAQFDRALEIIRARTGFNALEQAPIFREMIPNAENRGDFELEERLVALAAANADDPRAVGLYEEIADRQVAAFLRFQQQGTPFNVNVNERVRATYKVNPLFDERSAALAELERARENYAEAAALIRGGLDGGSELEALETKLVRTYYVEATLRNAMPPEAAYRSGEKIYRRMLAEKEAGSESAQSLASTLVALADWHLLFEHPRPAFERYRQAYDLLAAEPDAAELLSRLFVPEVPVRLPVFGANPLPAQPSDTGTEYLEVVVEVSEQGHAEATEVSAGGRDVPRDIENEIEREFVRGRFRPLFVDGDIAKNGRFHLRYPIDAARLSAGEG